MTVRSLLVFSLNPWNDRCDSIHGVDEEDAKRIIKKKLLIRVDDLFGRREEVEKDYGYLFKDGIELLHTPSIQYLTKWVTSFRMAKKVIERENMKDEAGAPVKRRARRKGKRTKGRLREEN